MRGRFTPEAAGEEWCERRLLARIHRYTIKRLRAEIEPVAARDFLRFLFDWQRVTADTRMEGPDALGGGVRAARRVRGAGRRVGDRDPAGAARRIRALLARRSLPRGSRRLGAAAAAQRGERAAAMPPGRCGPPRSRCWRAATCALWAIAVAGDRRRPRPNPRAQAVVDFIREHGASFFDEIVEGIGLLRPQVEEALAELVALGLVNSDSFAGLRRRS